MKWKENGGTGFWDENEFLKSDGYSYRCYIYTLQKEVQICTEAKFCAHPPTKIIENINCDWNLQDKKMCRNLLYKHVCLLMWSTVSRYMLLCKNKKNTLTQHIKRNLPTYPFNEASSRFDMIDKRCCPSMVSAQ